jgi:hypothetical protein
MSVFLLDAMMSEGDACPEPQRGCASLFNEHGDDAGGHEVGHGSGEHGAEAEASEIVATVGDEGADAADLNADGAEVREAAEGEGGDGEAAGGDDRFLCAEVGVGDQLVEHGAGAEEVADEFGFVPGDPDEPRYRREEEAEDGVEAGGEGNVVRGEVVVDAAEDSVGEADESEEADEHDGDVKGECAAVDGTAGDGSDEVLVAVLFGGRHLDDACGGGNVGFGDEHLGDKDGARGGHDDGREEIRRVDAVGDVSGHDSAGDVGHAGGHDGHELGVGGSVEKGADGKRGFGLAHEDAGGDVGGLGSRDAHGLLHDPGEGADDELHKADVIENGEEGRDEDDGGKNSEGEDREGGGIVAEITEDHGGAGDRVCEKLVDTVARGGEETLANGRLEDEDGEDELEAESPGHGAPADGSAIGGERVGQGDEGDKTE